MINLNEFNLSDLPNDCLYQIAKYLPLEDQKNFSEPAIQFT